MNPDRDPGERAVVADPFPDSVGSESARKQRGNDTGYDQNLQLSDADTTWWV